MSSGQKWLLCFRPPSTTVDMDLATDTATVDCSADKLLTYLAAAAKQQKRKETKIKNKAAEKAESTLYDGGCGSQSPPRRSFSGFVKAAFYRNALVRRAREKNRRLRRRSSSRRSSFVESLSESDRSDDSVVGDLKGGIRMRRIPGVEEGGRETAEDEAMVKGVVAEEEESEVRRRRGGVGCRMEWVFLALMILLVTVFCGRVLAVVGTTAWVYVWESRRRAAAAWKIVDEITAGRRWDLVRDSNVGKEEKRIFKNVVVLNRTKK